MRKDVLVYVILESVWCIFYFGAAMYIMTSTPTETGESQRTAIQFSILHLALVPAIIYAIEGKNKLIALGFVATMMSDINSVLQSALHLSHTEDLRPAFSINIAVASFGAFISMLAFLWYLSMWCCPQKKVKKTLLEDD